MTIGRPPTPVMDRLLPRIVQEPTGCWIWTGAITHLGYGHIWDQGRNRRVHRVAYENLVGPIPEGLHLDHLCRNRACCNPDHLEPVTSGENTLRGETLAAANAAKTHCPQGHPYAGRNLYRQPDGARVCRTCRKARREARRLEVAA